MTNVNLRDLKPCTLCGGKIDPIYYHVTIQQKGIDARSVQQSLGLMQMLGGSAMLADAMGSGLKIHDLTKWELNVCIECQGELLSLMGCAEEDPTP